MAEKDPLSCMEERAWASFALHAGQRLTTFNFFIVLSSLLINAMVLTFLKDFRVPYVGVVIGGLLAFLSFLFWKIEVRNKQLIKIAENVIKEFERMAAPASASSSVFHPGAFFCREESETAVLKAQSPRWYFSYSRAFNWVYMVVACVGLAGAAIATVTARQQPHSVAAPTGDEQHIDVTSSSAVPTSDDAPAGTVAKATSPQQVGPSHVDSPDASPTRKDPAAFTNTSVEDTSATPVTTSTATASTVTRSP